MAIKVNQEKCIACGACLSVCPFGAIVMQDEKAYITEACTTCGACIDTCPVQVILREEETKIVTIDKSLYKDVWVYLEVGEGKLRSIGLELLGEGRWRTV